MRLVLLGILGSVCLSSVAQLFLKVGMSDSKIINALERGDMLRLFATTATSWSVIVGLALYVLGALAWLLVLTKADVSFAYPFMGAAFVLTMFLAYVFLGEPVSTGRLLGTLVVVFGLIIVAKS